MSAAFQRFRYSFFEDPTSARDGLDTSALAALEGDDRRHAEIMLLGFLPDARAVIGLGVLRSRAAEPKLAALFEAERKQQIAARQDARMQPGGSDEWHPSALFYLAHALWRIEPDSRWPQAAIEVLSSAPHWVFRQEAVQALQDVSEPAAVPRGRRGRNVGRLSTLPIQLLRGPDVGTGRAGYARPHRA